MVFSGVGTDHDKRVPPEFVRFFRERPQHSALFVADDQRSWLNGPNIIEAVQQHVSRIRQARPEILRVVTLGNSMGGFSAIAMAADLGAHSAIAIAPQISIHPDIVPDEKRWRRFREAITEWRIRRIDLGLAPETLHFLFQGAHPKERQHWQPIPLMANVHHYIFPGQSHFIVRPMKEAGFLHPILAHAAARRPRRVRQCVERLGGLKRLHFERHLTRIDRGTSPDPALNDRPRGES